MLSLTVAAAYDDMRLDSYLFEAGLYGSRSKAAKQVESGKVFVNGEQAAKKLKVREGDFVVYEQVEESERIPMEPQDIPLDVVYEDAQLLVLNKQAGLICHPSPGHPDGTLSNALIHRYGREGVAHIQGDDRPGIVHRLDGDTSGLMLCAKTEEAGFALQDEIRARNVNRRYLCLVHGNIAKDSGLIDAPIFRSTKNRVRMEVSDKPQARSSVTTFKVLERFEAGPRDNGFTLVECKLYSGRTHQIRVHMAYIDHWVVGDPMYGTPGKSHNLGLSRQFLHSYFLEFEHPGTHETLAFMAQLPPDLRDALDSLFDRRSGLTEHGREAIAAYDALQHESFANVQGTQSWEVIGV